MGFLAFIEQTPSSSLLLLKLKLKKQKTQKCQVGPLGTEKALVRSLCVSLTEEGGHLLEQAGQRSQHWGRGRGELKPQLSSAWGNRSKLEGPFKVTSRGCLGAFGFKVLHSLEGGPLLPKVRSPVISALPRS